MTNAKAVYHGDIISDLGDFVFDMGTGKLYLSQVKLILTTRSVSMIGSLHI